MSGDGPLFTVSSITGERRQEHRIHSRFREYTAPHGGDCDGTLCDVCGCCQHCRFGDCGCAMAAVTTPFELTCPGYGCDCTGGGE